MLKILQIIIGEFSFRYLGVPMFTKNLANNQCQTPIDKVLARVKD